MDTKLTLTIAQDVIEKAKHYARREGRSLSDIVESYLKVMVRVTDEPGDQTELTPLIKSMRGAFTAPKDFDYHEELGKSLAEKYLSS